MNYFAEIKKTINSTLFRKISFILSCAVLFAVILFGLLLFLFEKEKLLSELKDYSNNKAEILSKSAERLLWNYDRISMDNMVVSQFSDRNILGIIIKNKNGSIYCGKIRTKKTILDINDSKSEILKESLYVIKKDIIVKNVFINPINTQNIGGIELYISDQYVKNRLNELLLEVLIISLILIFVIITIQSVLFKKYIISRITNLNYGITEIEKGNYDISLDSTGIDELTNIAVNINKMSHSLHNREVELTRLQKYLSDIIESMPSVLVSLDEKGNIIKWNNAAVNLTNIKENNAIGKNLWELSPALQKYKNSFQETLEKNRPIHLPRELLYYGEKKYFNVSLFPLMESSEKGVVLRLDDITEIEKKDEQLKQAQKLETIGTLAGGLAHDFNNILGCITGTISFLKYKMLRKPELPPEDLKKSLDVIDDSATRATNVVQQLLIISRKQELNFSLVDLNNSLEQITKICESSFNKCVEIKTKKYPRPAIVYGDKGQLEQVLLNLCVNGYQAMTMMRSNEEWNGGILSIEIEGIIEADEAFCNDHIQAEENKKYWLMTISDSGIGIPSEIIKKIFDPFFSTKDKDKGTGLGLAMVYNIVYQHRGFIDVSSKVGHGSTFRVYLPALDNESQKETEIPNKINLIRGEGLVLIIDDEKIIRYTAKTILEECGFSVILAEDGEEGIKVYREKESEIKAVLLDMIMPKLSGKKTYLELKKINPNVKAILVSGSPLEGKTEEILKLGIKKIIQKPFSLETLVSSLNEIMK